MTSEEIVLLCKALGLSFFDDFGGVEEFQTIALVVSVAGTKKNQVGKICIDETVLRYDA